MKKITLLLLALTLGFVNAKAIDLDFSVWEFYDQSGNPVTTVRAGQTYTLRATVRNNSEEPWTGTLPTFNLAGDTAGIDPNPPFPTPSLTGITLSDTEITLASGESRTFDVEITISRDWFENMDQDGNGIVIVWPTEGYTDDDDANNYGSIHVFVEFPASIAPVSSTAVKAYPNPSVDVVYIELKTPGMYNCELFSTDGRRVAAFARQSESGRLTIKKSELGSITSGNYLLRISNSGQFYHAQIRFE